MSVKVQVIFYSMHGHIYKMSEAVAAGAREVEGSQVDVYQVAELVPESALERTGAKVARQVFAHIPLASVEVLPAADAIIFGTPTRFGNMCAQMRNFLDQDRTAVAQRRPNRQGWKCIHVYSNSAW